MGLDTGALWRKVWIESRGRFVTGLSLLAVLACGVVFDYTAVAHLTPAARSIDTGDGILGRMIKDAIEVQRDYRGFVWWQWFRQNLAQTWTLFAVLLGSGGLLSQSSGPAALFTLSLPAPRRRVFGVRASMGLAQLFVLAVVPSLIIPLLSPAAGETYRVDAVLIHGLCLFVAGAVFFCVALMLSTVFSDLWRPLLLTCGAAVVMALVEQVVDGSRSFGVFQLMTGSLYFRTGALPWAGLLVSAIASAALLYVGAIRFARQDF
jgi:ABC-2 type transport system permease protein